ncbi:PPE domain-containing protein [Actinopolyspora mortivallis]|uniref:PPE domain-containing protein n=1 Tax=Actinopolyspora mortivallis TaxID=33906 RepID=UPI00037649EE|nr:PPE domain-containing protein [Actinopolyspora mortivallis]
MSEREDDYHSYEYVADKEEEAYRQHYGSGSGQQDTGAFGFLTDAVDRVRAQVKADQAARQYVRQQAESVTAEMRMRQRPADLGCTRYEAFPHKELARFVREDFDPNQVHEVGRVYNDHGAKLIDFAERLRQAAARTERTWTGDAGDAMRARVTTLSNHMGHSGQAAQLTANQIGMQAEAGEQARNSMPEDPEFDLKSELLDLASNPNPFTAVQRANEIREKAEQAQRAHQEAARVMGTMERSFGETAEKTPRFAPPPESPDDDSPGAVPTGVGSTETGAGSGTGNGFAASGGYSDPVGGGIPAGTHSAGTGAGTVTPAASGPSTGQPPVSSANQPSTTTPSWNSPDNTGGSRPGVVRGPDGTLYRQDPRTGQWMRQNPYNGRWAPVPPGGTVPGAGRGGGGTGGYTPGRTGGYAPGRAGGSGTGSGANPLGPGGRAGVGPTPASPTSSASGAAVPSNSNRGLGRMPVGAGAGTNSNDAEDEEHERKYVLDSDEIGDDLGLPRVAPPVLGARPDEEGGGH